MNNNVLKQLETITEYRDVLDCIRRQELPLVLWGVGDMASEVYGYLNDEGIEIGYVCVDDEYYKKGQVFHGQNVLSFKEVEEILRKYNIIIGHSYYEKIKCLKDNHKAVNEVFALFSVSYGVHDPTPLGYIRDRINEYELAYSLLEDDISRNCFISLLKTRVSGDYRHILPAFNGNMNFFNNDVFMVDYKEVYIDIGAYDGDTIKQFLMESDGKYKYIYAVEPDYDSVDKLKEYIKSKHLENVLISTCGAWNEKKMLMFAPERTQESSISNADAGSICIPVNRGDDMFEYTFSPTLIKINYFYGVEEAIMGCERIIKEYRPKIVCTVGFDADRICTIPQIIHNINRNYRIYLRFNRAMASALTLYAM